MVERCWNAEVTGSIPVLFLFYSRLANANFSGSFMEECLLKIERRIYYEQTSMAKQDNYKKERTETALSFHFSDFGMRGYISMVKPSGLFLRFSFSFW